MTFANLKIFPSAVNAIGLGNMFWVHSGITLLICTLAFLILPETRGKSLKELSQLYEKKKEKPFKVHSKVSPIPSLSKPEEVHQKPA